MKKAKDWHVLFCSAFWLPQMVALGIVVPTESQAEAPTPRRQLTLGGIVEKSNMDEQALKSELVELLARIKNAFDVDAVGIPERLEQIARLRVVEWRELEPVGARIASKLDIDLPTVAARLKSDTAPALVHYGVSTRSNKPGHVTGFSLALLELSTLTCISTSDVEQVFGQIPMVVRPLGKPMDGAPPHMAKWEAFSTLKSSSDVELTLRYSVSDETRPAVTCLESLSIASGWI